MSAARRRDAGRAGGRRAAAWAALVAGASLWAAASPTAAAAGPRWLCESLDAQGTLVHDVCGPCYLGNAPRWAPAAAAFVVDGGQLPAGLSESAWEAAAWDALAAWTGVEGSALVLRAGEAPGVEPPPRAFGAVDDLHELFWIADAEAWAAETLTGKGTLALSSVRYTCGEPREIFDADTALNGSAVGAMAGGAGGGGEAVETYWAPSCGGAPGCRSVRHVIAHELGHTAGLGHPCVDCRTSLMLAVTLDDFQPEAPLPADEDALRALYPAPGPPDPTPEPTPELGAEAGPEVGPEPGGEVAGEALTADGAEADAGPAAPPGCGACAGGKGRTSGWPSAVWLGLALVSWLRLRARPRRPARPGQPLPCRPRLPARPASPARGKMAPAALSTTASHDRASHDRELWRGNAGSALPRPRVPEGALPLQRCTGTLVAADPAECGPGPLNPECKDVCDGELEVTLADRFGVIDQAGASYDLLLGAVAATTGLNCALLGASAAHASLVTEGAGTADWVATEMRDGTVKTVYSGGCLWLGDPDDHGSLEGLVIEASVESTTGFMGQRP